jgi:hypothetical protein
MREAFEAALEEEDSNRMGEWFLPQLWDPAGSTALTWVALIQGFKEDAGCRGARYFRKFAGQKRFSRFFGLW